MKRIWLAIVLVAYGVFQWEAAFPEAGRAASETRVQAPTPHVPFPPGVSRNATLTSPGVAVPSALRLLLPAPDASGLWGYVDAETGVVVIPPRYNAGAEVFEGATAIVHQSYPEQGYRAVTAYGGAMDIVPHGAGIVDASGRELLSPQAYQLVTRAQVEQDDPSVTRDSDELYDILRGNEQGVLHVEKGWLLEPGRHSAIRFFMDGSFQYDDVYVPAGHAASGPRYKIPPGWFTVAPDAGAQTFLLEDAAHKESRENYGLSDKPCAMAVARWSGDFVTQAEYSEIIPYAACRRWAGYAATLSAKQPFADADGLLNIFDETGAILYTSPTASQPRDMNGEVFFSRANREDPWRGRDDVRLDPCSLGETVKPSGGVEQRDKRYVVFRQGSFFGLRDRGGGVTVPARYNNILPLGNGLFIAGTVDSMATRYGLMDGRENFIVPQIYRSIWPMGEGGALKAAIIEGNRERSRLLTRSGEPLTALAYTSLIDARYPGYILAERGGKSGLLNSEGKEIIPCSYESIVEVYAPDDPEAQGLFLALKNGQIGVLDATGRERTPFAAVDARPDLDAAKCGWTMLLNEERQRVGLLNYRTGAVIAPEYTRIDRRPDGIILSAPAGCFLADLQGNVLGRFEELHSMGNGVFSFKRGGKYGLVDAAGRERIPARYDTMLTRVAEGFWMGKYGEEVRERIIVRESDGSEVRIQ